jgi:hypothetical protein
VLLQKALTAHPALALTLVVHAACQAVQEAFHVVLTTRLQGHA